MSFNDIILPASVIADIYKNNLVDIIMEKKSAPVSITAETGLAPIQFLGKNLRKILVFVNYPEDVFIPEAQLEFLGKILLACKLDLGDIAIINTAKYALNSFDDINTLGPQSILIFGECITNFVTYSEETFFISADIKGINTITCPALEKFYKSTAESKQLKSRLWVSLQQFFKL
jgi:hypothetical protein